MSRSTGFKTARKKSVKRVGRLDDKAADAIQETVSEVHTAGRENIDSMLRKISGKLRRGYAKKMSKKSLKGLVGYVNSRARQTAFYARFVHDGTSNAKAFPFHDQAVLEFEGKHRARMGRALSDALDDRASPSGTGRSGGGIERSIN